MADVTPHFEFPFPEGDDEADGPGGIETLAQAVEDELLVRSHGKSIIPAEQTRTNVAYDLLGTPDRVQDLVLPEDGLIAVVFQAQAKCSTSDTGRAALFIGENQLKVIGEAGTPQTVAAAFGVPTVYRPLLSGPLGLIGDREATAYTGDVATGQAVAAVVRTGSVRGQGISLNNAAAIISLDYPAIAVTGMCLIQAAAGTYEVSVRFKSASGTVSVKERKLRVWTLAAGG